MADNPTAVNQSRSPGEGEGELEAEEGLPFENLMPFDDDADEGAEDDEAEAMHRATSRGAFAYIGAAKNAAEFTAYVQSYNFGTVPPDYVVLHHTASPYTVYTWPDTQNSPEAWLRSSKLEHAWDYGEQGLSDAQIRARRKPKLDSIRDFYANVRGWNAGPHLFIDERYIWLFTPMYDVGIHAAHGNSFRSGGKLHYSIGIEVVGYYEMRRWPPAVEALVRHAVRTLQGRLGTFQLRYMYADSAPGPNNLKFGGIASHRDYNKPTCPGAAITSQYYMSVIS